LSGQKTQLTQYRGGCTEKPGYFSAQMPLLMPKLIQKFPFFLNYSTIFLLILVFVVSRCKKESSAVINDNTISIYFNSSTIGSDLVDSAVITFTKGSDSIKELMVKENGELRTDLKALADGEWLTRISLYAHDQKDSYQRRYDLEAQTLITADKKGMRIAAATGFFDDQWKPRVIIASEDRSVVLTVALDPNDPYTDFVVREGQWDYSYIDRTSLYRNANGEQRTDGSSWECDGDCYADGSFQFEPNAFAGFSARMANRNWLKSEVFGLLMNSTTGKELNLYYLCNR
jgi:hypothetical protein